MTIYITDITFQFSCLHHWEACSIGIGNSIVSWLTKTEKIDICHMWEGPDYHCCMRSGDVVEKRSYLVSCHPHHWPWKGWDFSPVMLCETTTRNAMWAPNPIPHQRRERGRGLGSFLHAHHSCSPLEPGTVGKGRARSRNHYKTIYHHEIIIQFITAIRHNK